MSVLLIAGSAAEHSRTAALLDAVAQRLGLRQALIDRVRIRELSLQALLLADTTHATVRHALAQIASARAVVAGVCASDAQLPPDARGRYHTTPEIDQRLDGAVQRLLQEGLRMPDPGALAAAPSHPARCSA